MDDVHDIGGGVSATQLAQLICSNRALLHDALSRKQFFIPALKSSLCSHIYLREVRLGKLYAIKMYDVRRLNCTRPPSLTEATKMLVEGLKTLMQSSDCEKKQNLQIKRLLQHLEHRTGDMQWTLGMLSTFKTAGYGIPLFDSAYLPPKKKNAGDLPISATARSMLSNTDGFFSDLPALT